MKPSECRSLDDVRSEIDRIDERIVTLIGERAEYVKAAAVYKDTQAEVAAPERLASMLRVRRQWAAREGLDADVIEGIYRDLVRYFIARETEHWREQSDNRV
jgi:isochorismate pyruvate lyase